jgi:hypothetical protein
MILRGALISAAVALAGPACSAQWIDYKTPGVPRLPDGRPNLSAPPPKTLDGKPDLSGIWRGVSAGQYSYDYDVTQDLKPGDVQPWALALRQTRVQDFRKDSPLAHCFPVSVPFLTFRGLSRMVQTPALLVILYESPNSPSRTIYTDGRGLPEDPNPTWLGYSAGHWEQDTMVIHTAGFNDKGWLDVGGNPQTETLKLTERYRRPDFGHLETQVTFDDPKTFNKTFSLKITKTLEPDTVLLEDVCENERDRGHLQSGFTVAPEILARYAGTYEFPGGRKAVVSVSGDQLVVQDPASPLDRLFVARSETGFLSSVSQVSIEFVPDARGAVTHFVRTGAGKNEKAVRK